MRHVPTTSEDERGDKDAPSVDAIEPAYVAEHRAARQGAAGTRADGGRRGDLRGGLIAAELLAQPGASKFFKGGVVCYTKASKQQLLGIAPESSKPTSTEPHARELAMAAQTILAADWAIGETGVAGPTPNSRGIQPGVSALAACGPGGALARKTLFPDDRLGAADAYGQAPKIGRPDNMLAFRDAAIELLADAVEASAAGPNAKL